MITVEQYLMDRATLYPITSEMEANMHVLLDRVNDLEEEIGALFTVDSGYRPKAINDKLKNASKTSWHMVCAAVDIVDMKNGLALLLMKNRGLLEKHNLYMENLKKTDGTYATPTWCHLQIFPPHSGLRVFYAA